VKRRVAAEAPASWRATGRSPPRPRLPDGDEVHLWRASLAPARARVAELARTLSDEERERMARWTAPRDQRRFAVARGSLRELLGRYLDRDPASVAFAYGPAGKPELDGAQNRAGLRFNVAHSGDVALYAVTIGRRVGVDVEALRPLAELSELSRMVFSERERAELWSHPPSRRVPAFFDGWVRKEAVLKALGHGLGAGLDTTEVALARGGGRLLRAVDGDAGACDGWTLASVPMGSRYVAAVAVEGEPPRIVRGRVAASGPTGRTARVGPRTGGPQSID